jgi:type I restriction enzyme S subunit
MSEGYRRTEIGEMPIDWKVVSVNEVTVTHKQGYYTKDEYSPNGIKLVRITDLKNPKVDFSGMPSLKISDKDYEDFKIQEGDFLFARSGAIGRYGIVESVDFPAVFASYIIKFQFDTEVLINRFFGYFYESGLCVSQLKKISQGNANVNINAENIKSLKLPLPKLSEQQKIVEILSAIDEKIDVIDAQISQTAELKKGLMQKLLTKGIGHTQFKDSSLGEIPESWEVAELNSIFKNIVVGFVGSISVHYCDPIIGIPFIRTLNVKDGYFDLKGIEYVTRSFHEKNKKSQINNEDILIARVGANMGLICRVKDLKGEANAANVIIIKSAKNACSEFYSNFLSSSEGQKQIHAQGIGGAQEVFNTSLAKRLKVPLPPYSEQLQIAEVLTVVNEKTAILQEKKENYQRLKKGLMQQLLTGKIRVNQSIPQNVTA